MRWFSLSCYRDLCCLFCSWSCMSCVLVYSYEVCCLNIVTVMLILVTLAETESQSDSDFMMKVKKIIPPMLYFFICCPPTPRSFYRNFWNSCFFHWLKARVSWVSTRRLLYYRKIQWLKGGKQHQSVPRILAWQFRHEARQGSSAWMSQIQQMPQLEVLKL